MSAEQASWSPEKDGTGHTVLWVGEERLPLIWEEEWVVQSHEEGYVLNIIAWSRMMNIKFNFP